MTTVDFLSTAVQTLAPLMAAPVATMLTGALWKVWSWVDKKAKAQDRANMETELHTALSIGINRFIHDLAVKGWHDAATKAEILSVAAVYLSERFPDRVAQITNAAGAKTAPDATESLLTTLEGRFISSIKATFAVTALGGAANGSGPVPATTPPA